MLPLPWHHDGGGIGERGFGAIFDTLACILRSHLGTVLAIAIPDWHPSSVHRRVAPTLAPDFALSSDDPDRCDAGFHREGIRSSSMVSARR
ncbi:hypothetical protein [Thioalkalivibrio sp. HK1]|uniref:hypothetical protein n=1 Tax=Thioalkalivibrio sp. HK1 TaxID=1469245 RepID=UPI000472ABC5|nr:hypothetical protein [Thioalkalivibrio sp. HK1]